MQLRQTSGRACVRIGLAAVVLALAASPTALGVAEKPKPDALWQAFPLEPAGKPRPAVTPCCHPRRSESRDEPRPRRLSPPAPSEASRSDFVVLALAALLILLAACRCSVGKASVRTQAPPRHRAALAGSHVAACRRQRSAAPRLDDRDEFRPRGRERRAAEPHPDVLAPRYRWADRTSARRARPSLRAEMDSLIKRIWTDDSAAALIGAAIAGVAALAFIYLIG